MERESIGGWWGWCRVGNRGAEAHACAMTLFREAFCVVKICLFRLSFSAPGTIVSETCLTAVVESDGTIVVRAGAGVSGPDMSFANEDPSDVCQYQAAEHYQSDALLGIERVLHSCSEGIADGKVEGECILELDVEVMRGAVPVWGMYAVAEVAAYHYHADVHA